MEVTIKSSEIVKAEADPKVSKISLSENDNGMVKVYVQMCFFYLNKAGDPNFMSEDKLKSALRETLNDFPDLAGRMKILDNGSLEIDAQNQVHCTALLIVLLLYSIVCSVVLLMR